MAKLTRQKIPFTQVANEVLNDNTLSFKAKGLYAYLFSKPDDWDFSAHRIKLDSSDGRDSVLSALKELESKGYLQRIKLGDGRTDYCLKHNVNNPSTENTTLDSDPNPENPTYGKSHGGKIRTISNKEVIITKKLNNTNVLFEEFWEEYPPTRKQDKQKCLKKWNAITDNEKSILANTIIDDVIERKTKHADWVKNSAMYVPAPLVYLNNARWEAPIVQDAKAKPVPALIF